MNWKKAFVGAMVVLGIAAGLLAGIFVALPYTPPSERPPVGSTQGIGVNRLPTWAVVNISQITQTTSFTGQSWGSQGYSLADVYYNVDQVATYPAYLTLTLQVSPDNSNWYTYAAATDVLANNSTDTSGYTATLPVHLQFFRVTATVSNTVEGTAVTPTIRVLLH